MSRHYNQDYTVQQIKIILTSIKDCLREGNYIIALNENRQENRDFIAEYNLNSGKQLEILLGIEAEDFCHSMQNKKTGYEHEVLYVFVRRVMLYNIVGVEKMVEIYTKFNLIEYHDGKRTIVISFHKRNKMVSYPFR